MTHFNRRKALALMGGTVAASGLAAPALAANKKIKVGALRFTSHSGNFVGFERGYFADAGLDVEAEKGAIKVIGGALSEEAGIDGQKYLISDASYKAGVKTLKDLDGKKYAITQAGSSFHYMGSKMAAAEGINLSFTPLQKVGAIIGAMKSGQVDGWSIVPHIAKPLAKAGAWHMIANVSDYIPDYQVTTVFTSAKNAANERGMTEGFLNGFSRGVDDYAAAMIDGTADQDAMVDLIHKYVYTDRERAKAAPSIINGTMRINKGAALNMASIKDQLAWFQSEGLVDADITIEQLVDTSYVNIIGA